MTLSPRQKTIGGVRTQTNRKITGSPAFSLSYHLVPTLLNHQQTDWLGVDNGTSSVGELTRKELSARCCANLLREITRGRTMRDFLFVSVSGGSSFLVRTFDSDWLINPGRRLLLYTSYLPTYLLAVLFGSSSESGLSVRSVAVRRSAVILWFSFQLVAAIGK